MKYSKIPVEIEAIQLTTKNIKQVYEFIHGEGSVNLNCNMAWDYWEIYEKTVEKEGLRLKTLESDNETQIASIGDYVIRGIKGEYYPCKPDIFALTYSPSNLKDREQEEEITKLSILKEVYEEAILKFPNETWVNFEDRRLEPSKWLIFECMDRFSKLTTPKETEGEEILKKALNEIIAIQNNNASMTMNPVNLLVETTWIAQEALEKVEK